MATKGKSTKKPAKDKVTDVSAGATGSYEEKGPPSSSTEHAFQAEMQQLLHIIVHSLYSERDIFLRELISNASDALNKQRFLQLTDSNVRDKDAELKIEIAAGQDAKTVTVSDTGIGMTRAEMIANLGTIARSGTLEFVKKLGTSEPEKRRELIGQFGVGFYSTFMVATRVIVDSCPADPNEPATRWISSGGGSYTLEPSERTARGTTVRVELREEAEEFKDATRIESIVRRYSSFVAYPIQLDSKRLNTLEAIWSLPKEQVTKEQYDEFFKYLTHGFDEPFHVLHFSIDAPVQYRALLFIPKHVTNEVLYSRSGWGLKLYANRVFIQDDSQELIPLHLRFLRGVVDSEDLSLNVSREMVQQNPMLAKIRASLAGRVLRELKSLAESDAVKYAAFWHEYGKVVKEGLNSDAANQDRLLELARWNSSIGKDEHDLTSLKEYVSRMREGQKEIFYFSGPSRESIERNPSLEYFRKQGLEVLYGTDQVDDFVMAQLREFDGKKIASIDQADLETLKQAELAPADGEKLAGGDLEGLIGYIKETLGGRVANVIASKRLVESPAVLVSQDGTSANLARMMKMLDQQYQPAAKILEINPAHPLLRNLSRLLGHDRQDVLLREITEQVFENCLLVEGLVPKPDALVTRIQGLMERAAELSVHALGAAPRKDTAPDAPSP
jgi:molecular chaperone HtpG